MGFPKKILQQDLRNLLFPDLPDKLMRLKLIIARALSFHILTCGLHFSVKIGKRNLLAVDLTSDIRGASRCASAVHSPVKKNGPNNKRNKNDYHDSRRHISHFADHTTLFRLLFFAVLQVGVNLKLFFSASRRRFRSTGAQHRGINIFIG